LALVQSRGEKRSFEENTRKTKAVGRGGARPAELEKKEEDFHTTCPLRKLIDYSLLK